MYTELLFSSSSVSNVDSCWKYNCYVEWHVHTVDFEPICDLLHEANVNLCTGTQNKSCPGLNSSHHKLEHRISISFGAYI